MRQARRSFELTLGNAPAGHSGNTSSARQLQTETVMKQMRSLSLLVVLFGSVCHADDWPQWGGPQRDGVWREDGIVESFPTDGLLPRTWSTPIAEGYAGPAVADGRVYITDRQPDERNERILCLDAESGTEIWKHEHPARYTVSYPAGPRDSRDRRRARLHHWSSRTHVLL